MDRLVQQTGLQRYWPIVSQLYWRDFKIKYKRTAFGYAWSFFNPLLNLLVTAVFFKHLVGRGVENYTQFLFSGILTWGFIEGTLLFSMSSYLENEAFIKRVKLPLIIFPFVKYLNRSFDFLVTFVAMAIIGALFSFHFTSAVLYFPLATLILSIFILGLSFVLAPLLVYFRDMEYLTNVLLRISYFATPIIYTAESVPLHIQKYFLFNPFFYFIRLFQEILYYGRIPTLSMWISSACLAMIVFVFGYLINKKTEPEMVFYL